MYAYVHCKCACASISKYAFQGFFAKILLSFCVSASVCLAATLFLSFYLLSAFTVIVRFDFVTIFIFINHHPSFFASFFHPSIWVEFKTLSSRSMIYPQFVHCVGKPFTLSTHYFILFVLERATFCFCLF